MRSKLILVQALTLIIGFTGVLSEPLWADNKKKAVSREKHIVREGRTKSKDSRNIDFDAVDIGGERKTPLGTLVNNNKLDKNYDFVKIRLRWHPEMVQSASSLDTGATTR